MFCFFRILFVLSGMAAATGAAAQYRLYKTNPFAHQYFFAPSGFAQDPQKRHLQVFEGVFAQHQHVQPNGRTVLWGAIPPLIPRGETPIWWAIQNRYPKNATRGPILNWGCMALMYRQDRDNSSAIMVPYTSVTLGTPDLMLTAGGGLGAYTDGRNPENGRTMLRKIPPVITMHGMARIGRRSCLITENYVLLQNERWSAVSMNGVRYWKKRLALDIGMVLAPITEPGWPTGIERNWYAIPWISVHYRRKDRNLVDLGLLTSE
jgi:hypothetical protein